MPLSEAALEELLAAPPAAPNATVAYGDAAEQVLDWFTGAVPPRALLLAVHGGFWRAAYDRLHFSHACRAWADAGFAVASLEYRRVGHDGGGYPGTLHDVLAAAAAAVRGVRQADRVLLIGHSAGGQLALWLAAERTHWAGSMQIAGVVGLAAVSDLHAGFEQQLGRGAIAAFLGGDPETAAEAYQRASPEARLPLGVRQVLVHGELDDQVPHALVERYAEAARTAGDDIRVLTLPGAGHYCVVHPHAPEFAEVTRTLIELSR